ncbi:MAG TPA: anhydro-N-acetylmuramic acid kinase, partial [Gammaproteobacteria bacterium]
MAELFIGLMSGTSMDGIDAALVDLSGTPHVLATKSAPFDKALRGQLLDLCADNNDVHQLMSLDTILGQQFAQAALNVIQLAQVAPSKVRAIGSHGQTIRHEPHAPSPYSLQIGNPNLIAEITGITTVADFRRRDIAAGGEGAPLVPAFHNEVFRTSHNDRVVVNIGGIANITVLPKDRDKAITGFDTGPGNLLMDGWASIHLGKPYDTDGQWAQGG